MTPITHTAPLRLLPTLPDEPFPESAAELVWTYKGVVHCLVRTRIAGMDHPDVRALFQRLNALLAAEGIDRPKSFEDLPAVRGYYCGYVRFPRPILRGERGHLNRGLAAFVPVHGGITYARQEPDGSQVFGFDCGHALDERRPELLNHGWLKRETEILGECLRLARRYEMPYRRAHTTDSRRRIAQAYVTQAWRIAGRRPVGDNLGAVLQILSGRM